MPRTDPAQTAAIIFALTYVVLGFGSLRPLHIDRAGATLVGATAMVAFGVLTPGQAVAALDFHTLALLFGMMIVVAHLRLAGFFGWLGARVLAAARTPTGLLAAVTVLSGGLSALFVNDTVCLLLTPLVLEATLALGLIPPVFANNRCTDLDEHPTTLAATWYVSPDRTRRNNSDRSAGAKR